MRTVYDCIAHLIGSKAIAAMTAEGMVEAISENLYTEANQALLKPDHLHQLPQLVQDIILVIELDTELSINGIWGFLHNSAGLLLEDMLDTLYRIGALEDYAILNAISGVLSRHELSPQQLRDRTQASSLYEVSRLKTADEVHMKPRIETIAGEIQELAQNLYVYDSERNIFDDLIAYVEIHKGALVEFMTQQE